MKTIKVMGVAILAMAAVSSDALGSSALSKMSALNSSRLAKVNALHDNLSAKLKTKYGIDPKSDPTYKKISALSNSTLMFNRLANSLKYNHGYAVNTVYKGYYPYTTRAIKGANYVSTAALAKQQLALLKLKLGLR